MASLILHTGLPGSGKTLNAIKQLFEDPQFKNRPVYYYGLDGCTVEDWIELTREEVNTWWLLPDSSVIFIDEAQKLWRDRKRGTEPPKPVQEMEETRHLGITFFLTCQFPTQLDIGVRNLCGLHRHYERIFNTNFLKVIEYPKCKTSPDSRTEKKEGVSSKIKLDKKYYNYYKSANIHVEKSRIPAFVWVTILLLVAMFPIFYYVKSFLFKPEKEPIDIIPSVNHMMVSANAGDYAEKFNSRLVGHPYSARFYDSLVVPSTYPKISGCMQFIKCVCNTQQGTIINDMPEGVCRKYLEQGVFDFNPSEDEKNFTESLPTGEPCCAGDMS